MFYMYFQKVINKNIIKVTNCNYYMHILYKRNAWQYIIHIYCGHNVAWELL